MNIRILDRLPATMIHLYALRQMNLCLYAVHDGRQDILDTLLNAIPWLNFLMQSYFFMHPTILLSPGILLLMIHFVALPFLHLPVLLHNAGTLLHSKQCIEKQKKGEITMDEIKKFLDKKY